MAEYTIELYKLLNRGYKLDLDSYPIFDEGYRDYLNSKIIDHYYFREIGQETPDRFNFMLGRKMREIMPYYNKLYKSELIEYDPLAADYFSQNSAEDKTRYNLTDIKDTRKTGETTGDVYAGKSTQNKTFNLSGNSNEDIIGSDTETLTGNSNKDITGNYNKKGKSDDTTHDEFTKQKSIDENTTRQLTIKEDTTQDTTEKITSDSTTTNNLKTTSNTTMDGSGTNRTQGSKSSVFSDIPQSSITNSTTVNPDGSVTYTTTGYATTSTNESTVQSDNTTTTETSDSTTNNTGTVDVNSTSDRTMNQTGNRNETDSETSTRKQGEQESGTNDETKTNNWSEDGNNTENTKFDETQDIKKNNTQNTKFDESQNTDEHSNLIEDNERNIARNENVSSKRKQKDDTNENMRSSMFYKGRRGISPSDLIVKYRDSLLNIDMLIIGELENLFMGVF